MHKFPKGAVILFILFLIFLTTTIYFYKQTAELKSNPQKYVQEESKRLIEQVSQLILLPADEQPTIATVTDAEKLKDQPFFSNAKAGYKVLIYTKAKKAILFDPISNKIIEVAPINLGNPEGEFEEVKENSTFDDNDSEDNENVSE